MTKIPQPRLGFDHVFQRTKRGDVYSVIAVIYTSVSAANTVFYICLSEEQHNVVLDEVKEPLTLVYINGTWFPRSPNSVNTETTTTVRQHHSEKREAVRTYSDAEIARIGLINRHDMPVDLYLYEESEVVVDDWTYYQARTKANTLGKALNRQYGTLKVELYFTGLTQMVLGALHGFQATQLEVVLMWYNSKTKTYHPVDANDPYRDTLRRIREVLPDSPTPQEALKVLEEIRALIDVGPIT